MTGDPSHRPDGVAESPTSALWSLLAVGLLLASGALQLVASLERWVVLPRSWAPDEISIEDHRFDYFYPADPWENLGSTAQVYGVGMVLVGLAIMAMDRAAPRRDSAWQRPLVLVVASSFALVGVHAVTSGVLGVPSPLQYLPVQWVLACAGFLGLGLLASRWLSVSWSTSAAGWLLFGATLPGYVVATFLVAPAVAGYQSHDTTPWTETIVACTVLLAGVMMMLAAGESVIRSRLTGRVGTGV